MASWLSDTVLSLEGLTTYVFNRSAGAEFFITMLVEFSVPRAVGTRLDVYEPLTNEVPGYSMIFDDFRLVLVWLNVMSALCPCPSSNSNTFSAVPVHLIGYAHTSSLYMLVLSEAVPVVDVSSSSWRILMFLVVANFVSS